MGEARPNFDFTPLDHVDLGSSLGILDMDRASKIAGARFSLLCETGALMERALINFMLDVHTKYHGYQEVLPPFMANSKVFSAREICPNLPRICSRWKERIIT